jgi:hypothetical protein
MITELFQNFSGKHLYSDYNHFTELIEMMCLTNENTAILRNKRRILFFVNHGCDIEAQPYTAVQTRFMTCPYGCMSANSGCETKWQTTFYYLGHESCWT